MANVIELCRSCGFEIPADADHCPGCGPDRDVAPALAALQVAGLALPTRSVHLLPNTPPRRDPIVPAAVGSPTATRALIAVSSLFALVSALMMMLGWTVSLDRLALAVPADTAGRLYDGALVLAWIAVGTLAAAALALAAWCLGRAHRRHVRKQAAALLP